MKLDHLLQVLGEKSMSRDSEEVWMSLGEMEWVSWMEARMASQ